MKRTLEKPIFSMAMSERTGCLVMVRTTGDEVKVIGSLPRAESQMLADRVRNWREQTVLDAAPLSLRDAELDAIGVTK